MRPPLIQRNFGSSDGQLAVPEGFRTFNPLLRSEIETLFNPTQLYPTLLPFPLRYQLVPAQTYSGHVSACHPL